MAIQREAVVRNAEKLASRGRIDAAIREYRKVLAETPDDVATLNRVGDLYARTDRNEEAIKLYVQIAESYTAEGFFVKAIAIYKKIIKLDPTRLEVYEKLASLYHRQGLLNEARTQYQVLADYYLKHDNPTSATAIYERMIEVDPDDPALRVKLADLYREMKLLDKALGEYRSIAETMLAAGAADEAEQVYRRALDVDASNIGFITDAVLKLREAGQVGLAARLLTEAIERNPQANRVARLVGLEQPAGEAPGAAVEAAGVAGADTPIPEAPAAAEPGEVLDLDLGETELPTLEEAAVGLETGEEIEEPAAGEELVTEPPAAEPAASEPPAESSAFEEELELDLDEVFVLDFDPDEEPPASQVHPPPDLTEGREPGTATGRTLHRAFELDPDTLERTAAEVQPERIRQEEDLLTEAEVLSKYGLAEKAAERLGELLAINPTHVGALALQVRFHLESGAHLEAAASAERLRTIADEQSEAWRLTVERLEAAGHEVTAEAVVPPVEPVTLPGAPAAPEEVEATAADGLDLPLADAELELPLEPTLSGTIEVEEEPPAPASAAGDGADAADAPSTPAPAAAAPPAEPMVERRSGTPAPGPSPRRRRTDVDSLLAEIESGVGTTRRSRPPKEVVPPPPAVASDGDVGPPPATQPAPPAAAAEATGWLEDVERATASIGPADGGEVGADGDGLFSSEDDFFDLAAELEQELSREGELEDQELLLAQPKEQTLEEIVDGFKRGVSETLSPEDYATHYELGIAYREMGLLDEAIGEFQIAAKEPGLLVACCSMLGLSFLEKGLPELAVKWYQRGLAAPNAGEEDQLGLMYDLGNAQVALGDREAAYHTFVDLYGINSHYRDVVARLEDTRTRS